MDTVTFLALTFIMVMAIFFPWLGNRMSKPKRKPGMEFHRPQERQQERSQGRQDGRQDSRQGRQPDRQDRQSDRQPDRQSDRRQQSYPSHRIDVESQSRQYPPQYPSRQDGQRRPGEMLIPFIDDEE